MKDSPLYDLIKQEGIEEGIERGIELGIEKAKKEILKNMSLKGCDIDSIVDLTGLELEEVKKFLSIS
ncbi:MAG: hypothetical protein H7A23_21360 [Leptospiraceae bacterium]|nr:hypothetical protein [Leptospiraceae bacterium]MCP5497111.1 hypothetical protein [Leptospiraceae bacterium]